MQPVTNQVISGTQLIEELEKLERTPGAAYNLTFPPNFIFAHGPKNKPIFRGCEITMLVIAAGKDVPYGHFVVNMHDIEKGKPYELDVLRMIVRKPGNPVQVHYFRTDDKARAMPPQILMVGILEASYSQAREMLQHAKDIKPHVPAGPRWDDEYDEAYQQIVAGADKRKVKREFLAKHGKKAYQRFDQAMYRRRQRDKN